MTSQRSFEPRAGADRRLKPTQPWDALRPQGRRRLVRRDEERCSPHFVDQIDPISFVMAILLLILTVADGALTLLLLDQGCEEVNPAMGFLIGRSPVEFLMGKYLLTVAGLPFLLVFRHFTLFGTQFRVGHLIPISTLR